MSLGSALNAAVSGLRATQAGINVVSQNVANAGSVGYNRRVTTPVQTLAGNQTSGVRAGEVQRMLDLVAQRQLRLESSAAGYTGLRAGFASALERLFGQPGKQGSLDKAVNDFTQALQTLAANPGDPASRAIVVDRAGGLASVVAATAEGVQGLRTDAEGRIAASVERADGLLQAIQAINGKILTPQGRPVDPALLDERDRLIGELSTLMDLQVQTDQFNGVRLSTSAGQTLFDGSTAVRLSFDARSSLGPANLYAPDGTRGVGTITARSGTGAPVDLIERGAFRSGEIRAAIEMRDEMLVQAQRQLDELAAGLATALSETRTAGAANGTGYRVPVLPMALARGDALTVSYIDATGTRRDATILVQTGAPLLALNPSPADPSRPKLDYTAGTSTSPSPAFTITEGPAGLDIAPAAGITLLGVSHSRMGTTTAVPGGAPPLLIDRFSADPTYGGVHPAGIALTGLAQRLTVDPGVARDPARLNGYPPVFSGDATRVGALLDNLTRAQRAFPPAAGIGGASATYAGSVTDFARRVVETQAADAESSARLDEGQRIALAAIESRFAETSGVNIDQEMSQLVQLQTAYGANARVMSAVRDMLDMLMRI